MSKKSVVSNVGEMKPSMHVSGAEARALGRLPLGSRVSTRAEGRLVSVSQNTWDGKKSHDATIEFHSVKHSRTKRLARRKKLSAMRAGA